MIPFFCFDKIVIGPIVFYTWGVFFASAILLTYLLVLKRGVREGIASDIFQNLFFGVVLGIVVGGRLGYVLSRLAESRIAGQFPKEYFFDPLSILKIWEGGLALYGGLFGGIIFALIYFKIAKINFLAIWKITDSVALFLPLGIAVGRIGCFLINDHQGKQTSLFWGMLWPDETVRHPVALYYIISALIIFLIINFLKNKLSKPGQLSFAFLFLYPLFSFIVDFTRDDPRFFSLSLNQWISLAILFVAMIIIVRGFTKNKNLDIVKDILKCLSRRKKI